MGFSRLLHWYNARRPKEGPGEINVPISCGGINVNPGDIILADPDGVIAIPRNDAATVLEDAKKFQAADEKN